MLRAICRQCDRWEMIEARQNLKESIDKVRSRNLSVTSGVSDALPGSEEVTWNKNNLLLHQRRRRQRELLSLLVNAVERLQHFETLLIDWIRPLELLPNLLDGRNNDAEQITLIGESCNDPAVIRGIFRASAAWLANASQLLHLITRDVDFCKTFETDTTQDDAEAESGLGNMARSAWMLAQEQLTDVVQAAFGLLSELVVSRLEHVAIPHLLEQLERSVVNQLDSQGKDSKNDSTMNDDDDPHCSTKADWFTDDVPCESDVTLKLFTEILDCMHAAYVNPAFTVQLFARLLHRLNARLFNFLLGNPPEDEMFTSDKGEQLVNVHRTHVSPAWGRVLHRWIHAGLCAWAMAHGIGTAAECYLQRVSQAAELMLADISSVESLYNVTVDLVGLNSRQVRLLLENFVLSSCPRALASDSKEDVIQSDGHIPEAWIEFVVSGVKLVADRILAEEVEELPVNGATEGTTETKAWEPRLTEPLNLLLPLLLPEDSYPSDNPVAIDVITEDPTSLDSGISSRPSSAKSPCEVAARNDTQEPGEALITVESIRQFLAPAIECGWCRLSVRPICTRSEVVTTTTSTPSVPGHEVASDETASFGATSNLISWSVYLSDSGTARAPNSPAASQATTIQSDGLFTSGEPMKSLRSNIGNTCTQNKQDQLNFSAIDKPGEMHNTDQAASTPPPIGRSSDGSESPRAQTNSSIGRSFTVDCIDRLVWCARHQPLTVVVPKIGHSLGLSIIAARSEDGKDMGIYVRAVLPDSGASQARLLHPSTTIDCLNDDNFDSAQPPLQPGDHLLAVNDQPVTGLAQEAAVQLVASCTNEVRLTVVRNPDVRAALHGSTTSKGLQLIDANDSQFDPGCVECQLRSSFQLNPINLVSDENFAATASRKPTRVHPPPPPPPLAAVLRPTLPDHDPPPAPSALGPVMHLPSSRPWNGITTESSQTHESSNHRAFRSRPVCTIASGSSVSVTYKPAFPQRTSGMGKDNLSSKGITVPRVHPLKCYTSCSMNALNKEAASGSAQQAERILFRSRTLGRVPPPPPLSDVDDVASFEYSLDGKVNIPHRSPPSSPSVCTDLRPNPGEQVNPFPSVHHRPKGQSASLDEWVSASRIRDLCEKWSDGIPFPVENRILSGTVENAVPDYVNPSHAEAENDQSLNPHCSDLLSPLSSRGLVSARSYRHASLNNPANLVPPMGTSKPPTTFVPTALVLSCSSKQSDFSGSCANRRGDCRNFESDDCFPPVPWSSRSLGDLATLNQPREQPADNAIGSSGTLKAHSSRGLQRRHTTVTTNRLYLGPRPEPPNQPRPPPSSNIHP